MQLPIKLLIVSFAVLLSACASFNPPNKTFSYFHQQEQFNIALISLHKISILGLIDQTKSLTAQKKQQLTNYVFNAFADRVDAENLTSSEDLALQIGRLEYKKLRQAAKQNNSLELSKIMASNSQMSRYLLTIQLTENSDLGNNNTQPSVDFFNSNNCSRYGRAIGLTMTIIDSKTNSEVWGGHINKANQTSYCDDDHNWDGHDNSDINDSDSHDLKSALAALLVVFAISAMVDSQSDRSTNLSSTELMPTFQQAVNDFAIKLPSFYH